MFKPQFLQKILSNAMAGDRVDKVAENAKQMGFPMFEHNQAIFSTAHFLEIKKNDPNFTDYRKAILFNITDLIKNG